MSFMIDVKSKKKKNIAETHPELMKEWDWEKNVFHPENYTTGSNKKVCWICSKNKEHRWSASINLRCRVKNPNGCPFCRGLKANHTNCLATTHPILLEEWDWKRNILSPYEITAGCNKKFFWICKKHPENEWFVAPITRTGRRPRGCAICAGKKVDKTNCLATTHPELVKEWSEKNMSSPDEVSSGMKKKFWFKCLVNPLHEDYECAMYAKFIGKGCPICAGKRVDDTNKLFATHRHLKKEWDFTLNTLNPEKITAGCNKKAFWLCSRCGKSWKAWIPNRTREIEPRGCPVCSNQFSSGHEEVVKTLEKNGIKDFLINDRKTIKNPKTEYFLELDIFFPERKIAIEYNGIYWHSKRNVQKRDKIKQQICEENGIKLIIIWENEWKQNRDIVEKQLLSLFIEQTEEEKNGFFG